jgi:hypothetical protein
LLVLAGRQHHLADLTVVARFDLASAISFVAPLQRVRDEETRPQRDEPTVERFREWVSDHSSLKREQPMKLKGQQQMKSKGKHQ